MYAYHVRASVDKALLKVALWSGSRDAVFQILAPDRIYGIGNKAIGTANAEY